MCVASYRPGEGNRQEGQGSPDRENRLQVSDIFFISLLREGKGNPLQYSCLENPTCKISCMKRVASPGSMHHTGCLGLVHWDDPEGWYGGREEGGRFRMGNTPPKPPHTVDPPPCPAPPKPPWCTELAGSIWVLCTVSAQLCLFSPSPLPSTYPQSVHLSGRAHPSQESSPRRSIRSKPRALADI